MKKTIFPFLLLLIDLEVCHSQIDYDSCILKITKQQLINEIARYSESWINDSLAINGFRRFFGREFFRCSGSSLEGTDWSTISVYLGKPHFTFKARKGQTDFPDKIIHRYVLYTYGDYHDFKEIGNIILDVIIIKGLIKGAFVYENDG